MVRFKNRYLIVDMVWKNEGNLESVWTGSGGSGGGGGSRSETSTSEIFSSLKEAMLNFFGDAGWASAQASLQGGNSKN
jgi:hypothetical protein